MEDVLSQMEVVMVSAMLVYKTTMWYCYYMDGY